MSNSDETIKKYYRYNTVDGDAVIRDELDRLTRRRSRSVGEELLPETAPTGSEDVSESLTGLALSGGGIRSGALGLGILQTLHRSGILPFFDYLSTVSGGGYAGAYVTSAGSHNRNHAEDDSAHSKSHDDNVPYGRLKAFHDGEGLSERMQQFIFGGHYLLRTRRFFNRYLMGLLCIWFMTVTGLSTLAALAAILFRQLDAPLARHFLVGLGFRTDISRGFVPVMLLLVLWLVCWCLSFFRASGNLARAQGRFAARLIPVTVVTFGICLAALLGNGEFSLDWLSNPKGLDIAGVFSSAEKFFQIAIYGVIGIGLLPFLKPAALIRSGASPKSALDRVVFAVASRVVLYGLPFLVVSWFARENISEWTEHRFVTREIHEAGLRGKRNDDSEYESPTSGRQKTSGIGNVQGLQPPKPWNDFVALTRSEIAGWSDWQPAWAPFWTRLRAEAEADKLARTADAKKAEEAARVARADRTTRAVIALEQAMADSTAAMDESVRQGESEKKAADELADAKAAAEQAPDESVQQGESEKKAADELATALATAKKAFADTTKAATAVADDAVAKVEGVSAAQSAKDAAVKAEIEGRTERDTKDGKRRGADGLVEAARVTAVRKEDDAAKAKRAAENSKRRIAEHIWERLDTRIRVEENDEVRPGQSVNLPWVPGNRDEPAPPSGYVTFTGIEDVITRIHKESLALQELYACTDQKTDDYAPDGPHLVLDRLLSLASLGPDSLRGAAKYNSLGKFVLRRQRLTRLRNWLADHLSRILETTNLGEDCDWSEPDNTGRKKLRLETLAGLVEQAGLMSERHKSEDSNKAETGSTEQESGIGTGAVEEAAEKWNKQTLSVARMEAEARAKEEAETKAEAEVAAKAKEQEIMQDVLRLSHGERRHLARLNRRILDAAFPETLRDPSTVFASSVLEFDQARRWSMFWWCLGLFMIGGVMININATTLHSFYARELANNWIHSDKDSDHALSAADATDQCLPYHIFSGSVHWVGKRNKPAGDIQRDHFLFSPLYCGCEKTGFVSTSLYKDDELGLGDAIAISGAAVSPIQHGNPLLQALLWLSNLRLGQWLPNPNHGTFLPTKSRKLVARTPVTPLRILWRFFQVAERRPFVFVTDGGHHENLGIGPLLKRRCRFILAIDGGEDSDYSFTDLSRLMRWARVKHNVRLQPVDSDIEPTDSVSGGALATTVAGKTDAVREVRSAIDAWNDLAPKTDQRLSPDRLSARHFVVLRIHYPDVEGPSWLVFAKTTLTGDEPAELIRYAESDKKFPHNPTSNQFYAPDTFEAYRQLGEHIVESMVGQLPSIIAGKMDEHVGRPEAPYLGAMLEQIELARKTLPLNISAAPPTPEAFGLIQQLRKGKVASDVQHRLSKRLSIHPLFVSELLHAALLTEARLSSPLQAFLFPELGPATSPARQIFTQRRLPGRAEAMKKFKPKSGHVPDGELTECFIQLAETLAVIPEGTPDFQHAQQMLEYAAVRELLTKLRTSLSERSLKTRINRLPTEAKNPPTRKRKKTTNDKPSDAPSAD